MNTCCFLCNTRASVALRSATNLFDVTNTVPSGKKLHELLSQILDKTLTNDAVHSRIVCNKCYKSIIDYDYTNIILQEKKTDLLNQFKMSLQNSNLNYDTYEVDVRSKVPVKTYATEKKTMGKIVLPASKLQPLTPELLLKVGKLANVNKANFFMDKDKQPTLMSMATTLKQEERQTDILTTLANSLEPVTTSMSTDVKTFNISSLTKDLLDNGIGKQELNDDDEAMEIDEDCALSVVPVTSANGDLVLEVQGVKPSMKPKNTEYIDVSMLQSLESSQDSTGESNKFILGKLQILNDGDDDDEHTIVLDGDNGSILRMVTGQRFMYDGNQLALVSPENNSADNDNENGHEEYQVDEQDVFAEPDDSNDEPQIELQVSGDEETANAIIAAAQEQGGAFIKVESGEMFRVKSVQSKTQESQDNQEQETHSQEVQNIQIVQGQFHQQMVERRDGKFHCLLCRNIDSESSTAGDAAWTMRHLRHVHDARLYICRECGAIMRRRADYTAHLGSHGKKADGSGLSRDAARAHCCGVCGKAFASKYTLHAHHKTHADRPRPFKCKQCGKSFLTQQNLNQHEKTHSGIKDFVCNICNKAFSTQHNLEVHGVVHSGARPFVCSHCSKAFARKAELRDHLRTHTGERPYSCEICGATFTQRSNLHSHKRATHLDEKPHQCSQCPKRFKRRRLLDYHVKASHTGERPLKCGACAATFVYPEHYKKHVRIHSGERPYVCEICGKSFTSRDNRNTHRFVHSNKKPYECLSCGAGYMRKHLLYAHMNAAGHLAESIVVNQPRVTKISTNLLEGTNELRLGSADGKTIFRSGSLNLVQGNEDPLFIQALTEDRSEATLLEAVDAAQFEDAQLVTNDENGEMVRLIQIKLPGGNDGWVAVNN